MDDYRREYHTLGIAAAGVYATAPNRWGPPASVSIPNRRLTPYLGDLAEGGVVVDKRPCVDRDDFVRWVVSGPMLDETLPPGTMLPLNFGGDRTPVPCEDPRACKGFDYVALDVYLALWRGLGARIGKRVGETIEWEDGEVFPIPPAEERFRHAECDPKE